MDISTYNYVLSTRYLYIDTPHVYQSTVGISHLRNFIKNIVEKYTK